MSTESSENQRQFNPVESRRFIGMIAVSVQHEMFDKADIEKDAIEIVVDTYRASPPEGEEYADVKADAALDMLSNRLLMSPRKRLQIVRGHAHRVIQNQLRNEGNEPDMSTPENQAKIDSLVIALGPHMLLGQIARHYSHLHEQAKDITSEQYPDDTIGAVTTSFHNLIIEFMETDKITKRNAVGFMLMFGLQDYSSDSFVKMQQKLEVVTSKNILTEMLSDFPYAPKYNTLRKISELDARNDKTVAEMLNTVYKEYMDQEKMDVLEARRRFLIDSHKAMAELFEITD